MITTNSAGSALPASYGAAVAGPLVTYSLRLMLDGSELPCEVRTASLMLGCADDGNAGVPIGATYATRLDADLYDLTAPISGEELEVRVGVDVGGSTEWVTVAWATVATVRTNAAGVTSVRAWGRMAAKLETTAVGLAAGEYSPSAVCAAVQSACGVTVELGAFRSTSTTAYVAANWTCRQAVASLALSLGGFACDTHDGKVRVAPLSSTRTLAVGADAMTTLPSLDEADYAVDGLTVSVTTEGDTGSTTQNYTYGTGRLIISEPTMTEAKAQRLWQNVDGFTYRPGTVTTSIIDPRVTPFDVAGVPYGDGTATVPTLGIAASYDGGWYGTYVAPGVSDVAQSMGSEGPLSQAVADSTRVAAFAKVSAANAEASAQAAQASADAASGSAAAAQASADDAASAAAQAQGDAAAAGNAAAQAIADAATAEQHAQSAISDAATAKANAASAVADAATAKSAAQQAQSDAATASANAAQAVSDAATAKDAAESAVHDAQVANVAASEAKSDAVSARISATDAKASAERANAAANDALTQLSVVEDVAGTLSWISEHGTFAPTEDTEVVEGTVYFSHDGTDYVPVVPTGDEDPSAEGWYVLDVTESQADYVMSHLAVTASGLWVLPGGIGSAETPDLADGYKMLLASDGAYVYDGAGHLVTELGESIVLDSERPQHIGGEDAYILYYDSDGDGMPDSIVIGGERVSIGGRTLTDMFDDISQASAGVESAAEDIGALFAAMGGKADATSLADLATSLSDYKADNDSAWADAYDAFVTNATLDGYVRSADYESEISRLDGEIDLGVKKSEVWTDGEGEEAGAWAWDTAIRLAEDRIQTSVSETYATKDSTEQTRVLSGRIVTADDALAAPPRGLTVFGTSTQDGTPTPEAPVAIQSVDELALWVAGRNLLDLASSNGGTSAGLTVTPNGDGTFAVSGTATQASVNVWLAGAYGASAPVLFTLPAGTYTVTDCALFSGVGTVANANIGSSKTFTRAAATPITGIRAPTVINGTTYDTTIKPQLELGSTATEYEPYVGTSTPIDLQGHQLRSLPDGTRDELTVDSAGNVTLTRRVKSVDADTSGWTLGSNGATNSNGIAYVGLRTGLTGSSLTEGAKYLMSSLPKGKGNWASATGREVACYQQSLFYRFPSSGTATLASALADMRANGFEALIPYATVSTIGLGTIDLPTLPSPEFTAWTVDATDIELEYWRTAGAVSHENASDIAELSSTVTQQAGSITSLFNATGVLSTMVRQYGEGVLVCRTGQGIGALVSADGTFDVVSVSWSGGDDPVPTAGEPVTSIGGDRSYFGSTSGFRVAIETVGTGDDERQQLSFYDASNDLVAYMYGGLMYVENTMVLRTMRVGEDDPSTEQVEGWEWTYQDNGNLTLKWIG